MGEIGGGGISMDQVLAVVPVAGTGSPTAVVDQAAGSAGSPGQYAPFNHTHPSKARKARATTAADGTYTWTFDPPFTTGVTPIVCAIAETGVGVTDVVNVQVVGTPTNTSCKLQVNRTQRSVAAVLGLTILSVPASVGASVVHAIALEP